MAAEKRTEQNTPGQRKRHPEVSSIRGIAGSPLKLLSAPGDVSHMTYALLSAPPVEEIKCVRQTPWHILQTAPTACAAVLL